MAGGLAPSSLWVVRMVEERFHRDDEGRPLREGRTPPEYDGAVRALLDAPCEPPDFFVIEPPRPALVPPVLRAAWLDRLAGLIAPFAPDGSDRPVLDAARRMAAVMQDNGPDPVARAVRAFAGLDAIWGEIVASVEAGLRGAPCPTAIDAAIRDRLIATSPRAMFAALAAP